MDVSEAELDRRAAARAWRLRFIGGYLAQRFMAPEAAETAEVKAAAAILLDFVCHADGGFHKWHSMWVWEYGRHMYQNNLPLYWRSVRLLIDIGALKVLGPDGKCIDDPIVLDEMPKPVKQEYARGQRPGNLRPDFSAKDIPPTKWEPEYTFAWGDKVPPLPDFLDLMAEEEGRWDDFLRDYRPYTYRQIEKITGYSKSSVQEKWAKQEYNSKPLCTERWGQSYWLEKWVQVHRDAKPRAEREAKPRRRSTKKPSRRRNPD